MTSTQVIVDKLREKIEWDASRANLLHILAADHIEQLRAENERLRGALLKLVNSEWAVTPDWGPEHWQEAIDEARAALKEPDDA